MVIALGIVCVGLAAALVMVVRTLSAQHATAERAWADERRELLNRIQVPHHIPVAPQHFAPQQDDEPPDEWNMVGTIRNDPEAYLNGDLD